MPSFDSPGGCQLGMYGNQGHTIAEQHPKDNDCQKNKSKNTNLRRRYGKHIADEISIIFGKAGATQRGNKDTQSYSCAGEYADQCIRGMIAAASDKRKQQREYYREKDSDSRRCCYTADASNCYTREGRMSQGVREEAHFTCDDHGRHEAKQGSHQKYSKKCVFHEIPVKHFEGE